MDCRVCDQSERPKAKGLGQWTRSSNYWQALKFRYSHFSLVGIFMDWYDLVPDLWGRMMTFYFWAHVGRFALHQDLDCFNLKLSFSWWDGYSDTCCFGLNSNLAVTIRKKMASSVQLCLQQDQKLTIALPLKSHKWHLNFVCMSMIYIYIYIYSLSHIRFTLDTCLFVYTLINKWW